MFRYATPHCLQSALMMTGIGLVAVLAGCEDMATTNFQAVVVTDTYEATAVTIYTWQAEYRPQGVTPDRPNEGRLETFESSYRVNTNGQPVAGNVGDADAQGLWWPALPPQPTVDDLEARLKRREEFAAPQITQSVKYMLAFEDVGGEMMTLETQYPVYREAVKAYEAGRSLKLTLGREEAYVRAAEMQ